MIRRWGVLSTTAFVLNIIYLTVNLYNFIFNSDRVSGFGLQNSQWFNNRRSWAGRCGLIPAPLWLMPAPQLPHSGGLPNSVRPVPVLTWLAAEWGALLPRKGQGCRGREPPAASVCEGGEYSEGGTCSGFVMYQTLGRYFLILPSEFCDLRIIVPV